MAQEPTNDDNTANGDDTEKNKDCEAENNSNDNSIDNNDNDKDKSVESESKTNENDANNKSKISTDDIKDNTNDEEKKYESKEDIEKRNKLQKIPQNLEEKPLGKKNKIVIGSFEPSTFHYSFKNQKDPLQIGMFPIFGYLQIPHIGVYGGSYGMY